jgi:predicted metal-dependent HD superfamily phosphohydrolase
VTLKARFAHTARAAGATCTDAALAAVAAELVARWSEPHRHYHDLTHLRAVLDHVDAEPVAALAAWGHDAIYDPRSPANEERSAQLMASLLARCGIPSGEVMRLIRLTAGHRVDPGDRLGALLAEADLEILAAPWPRYQSYVDGVRAEYAHVPEELWRVGRAAVLEGLLPGLGEAARANVERELAALRRDTDR